MAVESIAGHIVFPHRPDWSNPPQWTRDWQTRVSGAIGGQEVREALRGKGRHGLTYTHRPYNQPESARLLNRIAAAKKLGLGAVPFFGRGLRILTATSGSSNVTLTEVPAWDLQEGDFLFFQTPGRVNFNEWETARVVSIAGAVIGFPGNITRTYAAQTLCWPLMFGKVTFEEPTQEDNWRASVGITVLQGATHPEDPTPAPNLEDFEECAAGTFVSPLLFTGAGFGPWEIGLIYPALAGLEDFEECAAGADVDASVLTGGGFTGWESGYIYPLPDPQGLEDFEECTAGSDVDAAVLLGTGFDGFESGALT